MYLSLKLCASALAVKHNHYTTQGLWVIVGLLVFLLLEKMFPDQESQEDSTSDSDLNFNSAVSIEPKVVFLGEFARCYTKVMWRSCFFSMDFMVICHMISPYVFGKTGFI